MKEGQETFQKKKVNKLNLEEAIEMRDFLRKCEQETSKKYGHVLSQIERLNNRQKN